MKRYYFGFLLLCHVLGGAAIGYYVLSLMSYYFGCGLNGTTSAAKCAERALLIGTRIDGMSSLIIGVIAGILIAWVLVILGIPKGKLGRQIGVAVIQTVVTQIIMSSLCVFFVVANMIANDYFLIQFVLIAFLARASLTAIAVTLYHIFGSAPAKQKKRKKQKKTS